MYGKVGVHTGKVHYSPKILLEGVLYIIRCRTFNFFIAVKLLKFVTPGCYTLRVVYAEVRKTYHVNIVYIKATLHQSAYKHICRKYVTT